MVQGRLTDRQRKVLDFLRAHIRCCGFPPTLREIGDGVAIENLTAVRGHLLALEKKGRILRSPDKARSIQLLEEPRSEPSRQSRINRASHKALKTDEGVVHRLVYGIAWVTLAREERLHAETVAAVGEALEKETAVRGWTLYEKNVEPSQVMVVVGACPSDPPDEIARRLQVTSGATAVAALGLAINCAVWSHEYAVTTELDSLEELAAELKG